MHEENFNIPHFHLSLRAKLIRKCICECAVYVILKFLLLVAKQVPILKTLLDAKHLYNQPLQPSSFVRSFPPSFCHNSVEFIDGPVLDMKSGGICVSVVGHLDPDDINIRDA